VAVTAVAKAGDRCIARFACAPDHMTFLRCDGEKMVVQGLCRGPHGCEIDTRGARCDQSVAEIGDPCEGDGAACSVDGFNMVVCRSGRWTLKSACTSGCEVSRRMKTVSCYGQDVSR
jgi:hypothetical protein